jgi:YD repeat-containing protein
MTIVRLGSPRVADDHARGRRTAVHDRQGNTSQLAYDARGNTIQEQTPSHTHCPTGTAEI